METPVTQEYFTDIKCSNPHCTDDHGGEFFMNSACHLGAATWFVVDTDNPSVGIVKCSVCMGEIIRVWIASADEVMARG